MYDDTPPASPRCSTSWRCGTRKLTGRTTSLTDSSVVDRSEPRSQPKMVTSLPSVGTASVDAFRRCGEWYDSRGTLASDDDSWLNTFSWARQHTVHPQRTDTHPTTHKTHTSRQNTTPIQDTTCNRRKIHFLGMRGGGGGKHSEHLVGRESK